MEASSEAWRWFLPENVTTNHELNKVIVERFGQFVPLRKEMIELYPIEPQALVGLLRDVKTIVQAIRMRKFDPKPSQSACLFCDMEEFCEHAYKKPVVVVNVEEHNGKQIVKF